MKTYFAFIFFSLFIITTSGKIDVFQNISIELGYNQIAFFETPHYPRLHNSNDFFLHNVTFYTKDTFVNGTRCVLLWQGLNWYESPFQSVNEIYVFNISSYFLQTFYFWQQYDALNGYLYFEQWNDDCPFESMSREKPYKFTDETEIIYISSFYENITTFGDIPIKSNGINSCKWQFKAPKGFGFKIVIQKINMFSKGHFQVFNSTDMFLNERSAKINHPFYNPDDFIQIFLNKGNSSTEIDFNAYVTIVKQNFEKSGGSCVIVNGNGTFTWASNANLTNGYDNNIACQFNLTVHAGTSFLITVDQWSLEEGVDLLFYRDDELSYELKRKNQFVLQPYKNNTDKEFIFEFIADGSYVCSGFVINFIENGKLPQFKL
uniref:CUB domain-containing protein n=1 Tax=Panagrolaimus davidi TaxID=227884 RepID=A0A914QSF4_9BILA